MSETTPAPWDYVANAQIGHHETESLSTSADQRLMAAAPEMYEALKDAEHALWAWVEHDDARGEDREALASVRAAIAKATEEEISGT